MKDSKVLFVTGASSDIGVALIKAVADNYVKIIAHCRSSRARLEELSTELGEKLEIVQADFADSKEVEAMIETLKGKSLMPDHIVHLAAVPSMNKQFRKTSWQDFETEIDADVRPIVQILSAFMPAMSKAKYGKVVFMLTSCTINTPKFKSTYTTAKYALLGLMKSLSAEYAEKGITVNGVSPDMIDTRFNDNVPDLIKEGNAKEMPLGRNLTVQDVVPAFAFLLSDGADTISGQNIPITQGK